MIQAQRVCINGVLARHNDHVFVANEHQQAVDHLGHLLSITVDGQALLPVSQKVYWLYHKPVGIDCRLLPDDPSSLLHQLPVSPRVYPAGRLDKDSRGLLLLTNDGDLTQRLMHPDFQHTKTYLVTVNKPFDSQFILQMAAGVSYQVANKSITTLPCKALQVAENKFEIVLTQGLNRQIRRMCLALGFRVTDLFRVAIAGVELGLLEQTKRRPVTAAELAMLNQFN
ncbi:pseudouridine synthase [Shewanella aestuarii]|nr:pseudouridine synthase [Shewanella aestuarii]